MTKPRESFIPDRNFESIELVLRMENAFGIAIENAEAESVDTPKKLIELIHQKVSAAPPGVCPTQHVFYDLRKLLLNELAVQRHEIRPDTNLRMLADKADVSQVTLWTAIQAKFPSLSGTHCQRPLSLSLALSLLFVLVTWAAVEWFRFIGTFYWGIWGVSAGVLAWSVGIWGTRVFRVRIPAFYRTPGAIARRSVSVTLSEALPQSREWSRGQIADVVKAAVIDVLDPGSYDEDADFVRDLGLTD